MRRMQLPRSVGGGGENLGMLVRRSCGGEALGGGIDEVWR